MAKEITVTVKPQVEEMLTEVERFSKEILNINIPDKPSLLPHERQKFAVNFLKEEIEEFDHAWAVGDIPEAADALIDLVYVALGRLIEMGIPPGPVFHEVQRANMEKQKGRTKRGDDTDATKPGDWNPPDHSWLLTLKREHVEVLRQEHDPGDVLVWKKPQTGGYLPVAKAAKAELADKKDPLAKPQTALIPYESIAAQADAMAYGAYVKYEPWDWTKGRPISQLKSSIDHHLAAAFDREDYDPESKVLHLGHALADIGMWVAFMAMGRKDLDDRRPRHTITYHRPDEEDR